MFKRPKVSLAGRLIITSIFVLTVFLPEILIMIRVPSQEYDTGMSLIRIVGEVVLYCFAMLGHGWARWITAFLLIMSAAIVIAAGRRNPSLAIVAAILYIPSIAILLGLKTVQPDDRTRSRRHRAHS